MLLTPVTELDKIRPVTSPASPGQSGCILLLTRALTSIRRNTVQEHFLLSLSPVNKPKDFLGNTAFHVPMDYSGIPLSWNFVILEQVCSPSLSPCCSTRSIPALRQRLSWTLQKNLFKCTSSFPLIARFLLDPWHTEKEYIVKQQHQLHLPSTAESQALTQI